MIRSVLEGVAFVEQDVIPRGNNGWTPYYIMGTMRNDPRMMPGSYHIT